MKIRPYRVCDICGNQYNKVDGCMKIKVKRYNNPMGYDELPIMDTMDICPRCGKILLLVVEERIKNLENKKRAGD